MTPDEFTNEEHFLDTGDGHQIYVHDWGNRDAKETVVFLHGGPGSGCSDKHKQWFDGNHQRVIFHDQRGSGRSLPAGSLEHNTTQDLIADMEKIVERYGLKNFILNGGSWGSCLALAYAISHPEQVRAMVLRGLFTGSQEEIDWVHTGGFKAYFPDVWDTYLARTPKEHHADPSAHHVPRALHGSPEEQKESAYALENLEYSVMSLDDRVGETPYDTYDPAGIRIEIHYLANRCFMPDNYLLEKVHGLNMPVWLVQGRYDSVCAPRVAYELSKRIPNAKLIWTIAGHSGGDRANNDAQKLLLARLTS